MLFSLLKYRSTEQNIGKMNYTIEKPKGIDEQIQYTQGILYKSLKQKWKTEGLNPDATLDVFGRIRKNPINPAGYYPEAYIGRGEYRDLYINDEVNATICFIEDDKDHDTDDMNQFYFADGKFVVMMNLKKCYPDIDHRADTEAQIDVINEIKKNKMFSITGVQKEIKNVFKGFNIEKIMTDDMQPFHIFAITGTMKYKINC